jgi:DNA (cytosine-5)-methyltransferase 1
MQLYLTTRLECRQFVTMKKTIHDFRSEREKLGLSQAKLAELADVPQHLLSAYELGKCDLPAKTIDAIERALADSRKVEELANRKKRYREHEYKKVERLDDRIERTSKTKGSAEYLHVLNQISQKHLAKKKDGPRAVSLFSGCGGFSLGFSAAGYEIVGFLELEKKLRDIYKLNFPKCRELGSDITAVSKESLEDYAASLGDVEMVIGGPPCQGFSLSGKRRVDDPRNELFRHYLRFVDAFRPKAAVLENVRLLTSMKNPAGRLVKNEIADAFSEHGYSVQLFEVNAKEYGVPQHRERVIFVAVREDLNFSPSLPLRTHGESVDLFGEVKPYRTFGDACSDLEYLESGDRSQDPFHEAVKHPSHVIEWLWDVPEGASAHDNKDEKLRPPSGYNTTYKRQIWREPASTVQTTFGMISGCRNVHPVATRSLTIREAARIQSFPDTYKFIGSLGAVRTGIGNAVPPLLANAIAKHLLTYLR